MVRVAGQGPVVAVVTTSAILVCCHFSYHKSRGATHNTCFLFSSGERNINSLITCVVLLLTNMMCRWTCPTDEVQYKCHVLPVRLAAMMPIKHYMVQLREDTGQWRTVATR